MRLATLSNGTPDGALVVVSRDAQRFLPSNGTLQQAVERYRQRQGSAPQSLQQLLAAGMLKSLPRDPFGGAYVIDANGHPQAIEPGTPAGREAVAK